MADSTTTSEYDALPGLECREMVELITSYLEGRLSPEDTFRFERHLSRCPNCTAYLAQMRMTIAAAGQVRAEGLSPQKREELLELFRDWRKAS
jgi:anti-sigma factor RsiW